MKEKNVSSLVVMDVNNQAVGIVTERDLVSQVCYHEVSSKEYIILHVMSSPVATIDPDSTVETARQFDAREQGKTSGSCR